MRAVSIDLTMLSKAVRIALIVSDIESVSALSRLTRVERSRLSCGLYGELQLKPDERDRVAGVLGIDPWEGQHGC